MRRILSCLAALLVAGFGLQATARPPALDHATPQAVPVPALDDIVLDVCTKDLVLLGEEPHHGGGRTLEVKTALVEQLVTRCGFNAVYFESSAFEFFDFNRRLAAGTTSPTQLADAIGGLWNRSNAIDPLVKFLYAQASAGRVRLDGIDAQLGSATSGYERAGLVSDLTRALPEAHRTSCTDILSRKANYTYDAAHPDDAAEQDRVNACFSEAAKARPESPLTVLADAALQLLLHPATSGAGWESRERQMTRLFDWHQRAAPGRARAIVWTANVHAARSAAAVAGSLRPFGDDVHAAYGERAAAIAVTALGGAFGARTVAQFPAADPSSLESRALSSSALPLRYLPKSALVELGVVSGSLLDYAKPRRADWSTLFDGVIVLREEKAMSLDRPAKPRFVPRG